MLATIRSFGMWGPVVADAMVPVDVEAALVRLLGPAVGARVVTTVPNPHPGRLVRVGRIGGVRTDVVVEKPLVLVECWESSEPAAWALLQSVYAALTGAVQTFIAPGVWLYGVSLSGGVNYPDPASTYSRYQLTAELWVRLGAA